MVWLFIVICNLALIPDNCDFETSNICGYTQDKSDDFDWTRASGGTTSAGTGPSSDHTYGTKAGKYNISQIYVLSDMQFTQ